MLKYIPKWLSRLLIGAGAVLVVSIVMILVAESIAFWHQHPKIRQAASKNVRKTVAEDCSMFVNGDGRDVVRSYVKGAISNLIEDSNVDSVSIVSPQKARRFRIYQHGQLTLEWDKLKEHALHAIRPMLPRQMTVTTKSRTYFSCKGGFMQFRTVGRCTETSGAAGSYVVVESRWRDRSCWQPGHLGLLRDVAQTILNPGSLFSTDPQLQRARHKADLFLEGNGIDSTEEIDETFRCLGVPAAWREEAGFSKPRSLEDAREWLARDVFMKQTQQ